MNKIELLSPAKDIECGISAINFGADAVYIGAEAFGAREKAGNTIDDISKLIEYAHKYWAKVYVTINTILYEHELDTAFDLIKQVYSIGADGVIIQDLGLLEYDLPPIPIIASTQMHCNTVEKIAFFEKVGFKRVILPRELNIHDISHIKNNTNIELECFVHGALCVGVSGQCYLSYALGNRSGNRGQCAQPCRREYTLKDNDGNVLVRNKHLLCIKDLNLTEYLKDLIDVGITSFKIEGRLKDKSYVSNVTAHYRKHLDAILSNNNLDKTSSGTTHFDFYSNVNKTFNRDYTHNNISGTFEKIGRLDTPKMTGELIGKVVYLQGRKIVFDRNIDLNQGDGICFYGTNDALRGTNINHVGENYIIVDKANGIQIDTLIYRNYDHAFHKELDSSKTQRKISISFFLSDSPDGVLINAIDEDNISVLYKLKLEDRQLAQNTEKAIDNITSQLSKTGNSIFKIENVNINLKEVLFIPISVLNEARRNILDLLEQERQRLRPKDIGKILDNNNPYPEKELAFEGNALNKMAKAFYEKHGVKVLEPAAEYGLDLKDRKVMTTKHCIRREYDMCPKTNKQNCNDNLYLVSLENDIIRVEFDCRKCRMHLYLEERR